MEQFCLERISVIIFSKLRDKSLVFSFSKRNVEGVFSNKAIRRKLVVVLVQISVMLFNKSRDNFLSV